MAEKKRKKKNNKSSSGKKKTVRSKIQKQVPEKKPEVNPYAVFQNRKCKRAILGERVRGAKRNVSRTHATAIRERTAGLLRESLTAQKTSQFKDARLGEGHSGASEIDHRAAQRMVRLRQKEAKRSFNLLNSSAEELTHAGKPLSQFQDHELRAEEAGFDEDEDANRELEEALTGNDPDDPVTKSKLQKAEAAKQRQEQESMLGKFDEEFGSLMADLNFRPPKSMQPLSKNDSDGYDRLVRTLGLQQKALASERIKSPEEVAQERAEQLAAYERERLSRTGASADHAVDEDEPHQDQSNNRLKGNEEKGDTGADEESADEEEEGEEEDGEDQEEEPAEPEKSDDEDEEQEAAEDEDDRLGPRCPDLLSQGHSSDMNIMVNGKGESNLPYAPPCPGDAAEVSALFAEYKPLTAVKLLERVRTCTAAVLTTENKSKLRIFFVALLDYLLQTMARSDGDISAKGMTMFHALQPKLVGMAKEHPDEAHAYFSKKLQAMSPSTIPRAKELCCLKLITLLFPMSDSRHPVVTPAGILADHWASRVAALRSQIEDLVSDALLLWEILYAFIVPASRYSASLFQLGMAILESCWTSAHAGRHDCAEAAQDVCRLLLRALKRLAECEPACAYVAANNLLRPDISRIAGSQVNDGNIRAQLEMLGGGISEILSTNGSEGLEPLMLFQASAPPQIRMLDPIFHDVGDGPLTKGAELTETKQLQRIVTKERRAASRQLSRDAAVLQQMALKKDTTRRVARNNERQRVRRIMEVEKQELKKLKTESGGGMDTSLQRYSSKKEQKRLNPRMAGNATVAREMPTQDASSKNAQDAGKSKTRNKGARDGK